ncbi:unnamed protein product [Pleuronectes platessa]|uniref:Uncharacterized protein n=1 Tax=Pleuronectes platessa TaxID=8262 RepID=A0A9N7Z2U0_PLEPL|nr:unnamed protein product [Pleuronectes platessa]
MLWNNGEKKPERWHVAAGVRAGVRSFPRRNVPPVLSERSAEDARLLSIITGGTRGLVRLLTHPTVTLRRLTTTERSFISEPRPCARLPPKKAQLGMFGPACHTVPTAPGSIPGDEEHNLCFST